MLNPKDALKIEKIPYKCIRKDKEYVTYYPLYYYECLSCKSEIRSQKQYLIKHSGLCVNCSQRGLPYKAIYNELCKSKHLTKEKNVDLTYEEFLEFTKINQCHYCYSPIVWHPHTKQNGIDVKGSRAYKLDRKNNDEGYSKENCVVCCWKCNSAKGNRYLYEEWFGMTKYFRNKDNV